MIGWLRLAFGLAVAAVVTPALLSWQMLAMRFGWNEKPAQGTPNVVHYTRGGPWFAEWQNVDYADLWNAERDRLANRPL